MDAPRPIDLEPVCSGEIVGAKYRIGDVIGVGGMGIVYEAMQFHLGRSVAIKFLASSACASTEAVGRFLREARAVAQLDSDNVVRVLDTGALPDGTPYIVMERLRGCDLGRLLETRGPLPCDEAARYVIEACRGLEAAHRLGLVHRDLKLQNLFAAERAGGGTIVKVLDFGISKIIEGSSPLAFDGVSTSSAAILGSPPYMSPEQLRSAKEVDTRTDIWALGVVLFELVTGARPFAGETHAALTKAVADDPAPPLRARRPDAPLALERVVARCLEKTPDDRYPDVRALATHLEAATSGAPSEAPPVPRPKPRVRSRVARGALIVVAIVSLLVIAVRLRPARDDSPVRAPSPMTSTAPLAAATGEDAAPLPALLDASLPPPPVSASVIAPVFPRDRHAVPVRAPSSASASRPPRSADASIAPPVDPFEGVLDRN